MITKLSNLLLYTNNTEDLFFCVVPAIELFGFSHFASEQSDST